MAPSPLADQLPAPRRRLAALAGSQPTPHASTAAFASRISASDTASTTPFVSRIAITARSYDAGSPIRIAVATVSALTACRVAKSSAKLCAKGAAPAACTAARRGHARDQPPLLRLAQRFPERGGVAEVARGQHDPVRRVPAELLQHLEDDRLLPLEAERVDRVEQVDAELRARLPRPAGGSRRSRRARAECVAP